MRHPYARLALATCAVLAAAAAPADAGTLAFYESSQSPGTTLVLPGSGLGLSADIDYDASTGEGGGLKGRISELEILAIGAIDFTAFVCLSTSTTAGESCLVGEASADRIFLTAGDSSGQGPFGGNPSSLQSIYDLGTIDFDAFGVGSIQLTGCNYTSAEGATGQLRTCDSFTLVQVVPEPGTGALLALGLGGLALRRRRFRSARLIPVALAALVLGSATGVAQAQVPDATVSGPIPVGLAPNDHPLWDSWFEVGSLGYVEEEYFVSGTARRHPAGDDADYTTRIIVWRPADPADFNGTVFMDWVNVTAQFENAVHLVSAHDFLLREGYAFVHVSAQSTGLCCTPLTPKVWNPLRYAAIDHPDPSGTFQNNYDIDIFAQIAQALRAPAGTDPMGGLAVERVIAGGQSQSAGRLDTYVREWQGGSGGSVIDAFLIHGGGSKTALSDGANAPVLHLLSDAEASTAEPSVAPNYVLWEVAGSAHSDFWIGVHQEEGQGPRTGGAPQLPATADEDLHRGMPPYTAAENYGEQVDPGQPACILQGNQFPMHYSVNAAIHHLDQWLRSGDKPPAAPRYAFEGGSLARDEHQNALGGIRLAPVEHPVAAYLSTTCGLGGTTVPKSDPEIHDLYATHAEYACLMKDTSYQNAQEGWILREDAVDLLDRVDAATNRWLTALPPGGIGVQDCDADGVADQIDNCPHVPNAGQEDTGGVGVVTMDGVGNACQCGDVTADGIVDGFDRAAIERHGLGITPNPEFRVPGNCDVNGDGLCNGQDGSASQRAANGLPALFGQNCQNADPFAPPCANCGEGAGTTYFIADGPGEQSEALTAFFLAVAGDTIEFGEGAFELRTTLVMAHKENITIKGQGRDATVLDFLESNSAEGISLSHMTGVTVEDLTIFDTPGFSLKVSDSDHVTLRNLLTGWSSKDTDPSDGIDDRGGMDPRIPSTLDVACLHESSFPESTGVYVDALGVTRNYVPDSGNGGYAIYPVLSNHVLIENVVALGSSDAGIYVGQSNDVIVRNSEALFNVAGFEIENTDRADMYDNVAHCNTGGFLIFDLPGLNQYGDRTRAFDNYSGYNNTPNFAPGGIVAAVPQGIGFLQLGYDETEIFGNTIEWNRTVGLVYVSHELVDSNRNNPDKRMDLYPEGMHVHDNVFDSNGTLIQPPSEGAITCAEDTGPGFDSVPPCVPVDFDDSHDSLLPTLVAIKGALAADGYGPTGAHIVWDGILDLEANGCALDPAFAGIVDANGKPQYTGEHNPSCRYNDYKFTDPADPGTRRHPQYWSCIADEGDPGGNTFSVNSRKYMNFKNTDPTDPPLIDIDAHDCPGAFGSQLAALPQAVVEDYVPGENGDPPPGAEEIAAICEDFSGDDINRQALPFNCEWLSQYNLFADATDPRSGAHEGGILFDLTTPLFSDYALKHRFLFLPPGETASWKEGNSSEPNATLGLPVGTVIAKTFGFPDQGVEDVVETRLLIHREGKGGRSFWEGMAYIWETDAQGNRIDARLAVPGGEAAVTWDYPDPDPEVAAHYVGSTDRYAIPHANQCGNCHINDDRQPGDAPIGLKVRLLNRPMDYGSGPENQLQHWVDQGLLSGAPGLGVDAQGVATNALRAPRFAVEGDAASIPASEPGRIDQMTAGEVDRELRARAWMESNCAHCHNRDGLAQSTGVFLDTFRPVDLNYGICKSPTTAGSSSGGRNFDIVPGSAADSIVSFRLHSVLPSAQMPPIARSVAHDEALIVVDGWIDDVIDGRYAGSGCEE